MIEGWRESKWGDEISLNYGKAIRGYQNAEADYRVFGTNGPVGWHHEPLTEGPGVILGRKGAYRGVHYSEEPFYVIDTAYYVQPKSELNMRWLYYSVIYHQLGEIDDGSPIPSTTRAAVYVRDVDIPPRPEQDAIAETLGALDDKIEVNRRTNETLEAMARAVFRDWFVDFGPTRRQMAGASDPLAILGGLIRNPEEAHHLAPLFPAMLDDDGLPEGWEEGTLADYAIEIKDTVKPTEIDPSTPYIGLEHMPRRSIALGEWEPASKVTSNKARFENGQILFGKLRPYFHKTGIAPLAGICSTDIVVIDANEGSYRSFVTSCVSTKEFVDFTDQTSTGTKMPRTKWATMKGFLIAKAPTEILDAFDNIAAPLLEKVTASIGENRTLASTRDLLLPKFMSGEIRLAGTING